MAHQLGVSLEYLKQTINLNQCISVIQGVSEKTEQT